MYTLIMLFLLMFFCSMCVLAGQLDIPTLPDPFALPPRQGSIGSSSGTVVLEGVFEVEGKPCVALASGSDHEILSIGAVFKGYTVVTIDKQSVHLKKGEETETLTLD